MIKRIVQGLTALALIAGGLGTSAPTVAQSRLETAVKANYLVRFAAFVEWPSQAFTRSDAPLVVCVSGGDPFGSALTRAAAGQTAHGRAIRVQSGVTDPAAAGCHILYLGAGASPALGASARPLLTVSDDAAQTRGGVLHFVIQSSRVRFHIDETTARARGLSISSRLLALAITVRGRG